MNKGSEKYCKLKAKPLPCHKTRRYCFSQEVLSTEAEYQKGRSLKTGFHGTMMNGKLQTTWGYSVAWKINCCERVGEG